MNGYGNRRRSNQIVTLAAAGLFVAISVVFENVAHAGVSATTRAFFGALEGSWVGKAEVTPIGPRPYDIIFTRVSPARLEGHAEPGAATHYWAFYEDAGDVRLRFLSTFAGNQTPIYLDVVDRSENTITFQARNPAFLKLLIRPQEGQVNIDVFHNDRLHVAIRLTRR